MQRLLLVATLLLSASTAQAEPHWPEFRGPTGDGHAPPCEPAREWSEEEHVTWKTAIHDRGWSSPVVWGDQVWMTTATADGKQLYAVCVDYATGRILHDLRLFEVESPREIHKLNSYASPTPVIERGRVYVHFGSYGTACLDSASGQVLWQRRDLPCHHWRGPGSSPILFEDLLIVHFDGYDYQYLVALDKESGDTVWKTDRDYDFGTDNGDYKKAYSTPIVIEFEGKKQLISSASKATLAYEPRTGKEIWRVRYDRFSSTARPLFGHGLVFANTGFGKAELLAVRPDGRGDVTETHVEWMVKKGIGSKPSQLLVDELLYAVDDGGVATCLKAATGQVVWVKRLGGNYSASPILAGGLIYFCSHEGKTTVIRPGREFEELAVNQLDDGFMASPAVVDNSLILRSRSHLYRIDP